MTTAQYLRVHANASPSKLRDIVKNVIFVHDDVDYLKRLVGDAGGMDYVFRFLWYDGAVPTDADDAEPGDGAPRRQRAQSGRSWIEHCCYRNAHQCLRWLFGEVVRNHLRKEREHRERLQEEGEQRHISDMSSITSASERQPSTTDKSEGNDCRDDDGKNSVGEGEQGLVKIIQQLLEYPSASYCGANYVAVATLRNSYQCLSLLLEYGGLDPNAPINAHGATAAHLAAWKDHVECLRVLHSGTYACRFEDGDECDEELSFQSAASSQREDEIDNEEQYSHREAFSSMLTAKPGKEERWSAEWTGANALGETPLHVAAREGATKCMKKAPEGPLYMDVAQQPPLHAAVANNHVSTVSELLDSGVDVDQPDMMGRTAISAAAKLGYFEMVQMLIASGANVNTRSSRAESREAQINAAADQKRRSNRVAKSLLPHITHPTVGGSKSALRQLINPLEAQQKLKALYSASQSKENDPASDNNSNSNSSSGARQRTTRSGRSLGRSMSPNAGMSANDDANSAGGAGGGAPKSAVTPSPKPADKEASSSPGSPPKAESAEELAARAARRAEWPMTNVMEPGPNDCLFGRGGGTNHHPGNKLYRKMVEDKKDKYLHSKRLDKPLVAMEIINEWRGLDPPGRFLKQDDDTKLWNDVGDKKAREKTSQALREKTPVKQRDDYDPRQRTARFEPGTSSPVGRHVKRGALARDHSLGETFVGNDISLEGFSWDDSDRPVVSGADAHVRDGGHPGHYGHPPPHYGGQYQHAREHSFSNNPLSDATVAHPAAPGAFGDRPPYYGHPYPGYGPPPPGGHPHPPPPSYYPSHHYAEQTPPQHRPREHSLQMNPLQGATTAQPAPAREVFNDEGSHASYPGPPPLPSPTYDGRPPPLPPPYYGGYAPSPTNGWPAPPPTPQFTYQPGRNPSAFGQYSSDERSNSMRSLGSSVDAFYAKRDSNASSRGGKKDTNKEDPASAGTSQDYSKIAELIRDSSDKSTGVERAASLDDSGAKGKRDEDEIPRSQSLPYEDSGSAVGRPEGAEGTEEDDKRATPSGLMRKLSGGAMAVTNVQPPNGILRPAPVTVEGRPDLAKRDTSNQPETLETKRSVKRVVLSRDQSHVSRRLKAEQLAAQAIKEVPAMRSRVSSNISKADIDRKLSVEINKLGLEDISDSNGASIPLDRMTTEDVLGSLIDDDELGSPGPQMDPPEPIAEGGRLTTIDAIAMDIANGGSGNEWEATLDLVNEPGPVAVPNRESAGVNAEIAEKWLRSGET
ncbi:hypothetical protein ACHAXT_006965 [Thalassiosira profunda]